MVMSQEMSPLTSAKDGVKTTKEQLGEEEHTVLGEAAPGDFTTPKAPLAALDCMELLLAAESLENMRWWAQVCK